MNIDERVAVAEDDLIAFLERYKSPSGLDDGAIAKSIVAISEAFSRHLPVTNKDRYRENIAKVFERVSDSHASYAWPTQGEFVENMTFSGISTKRAQETYATDDREIAATNMNAGRGVAERWIWGGESTALVSARLISRDVLESYRAASVSQFSRAYSKEAQTMMEKKIGMVVSAYFNAERSG